MRYGPIPKHVLDSIKVVKTRMDNEGNHSQDIYSLLVNRGSRGSRDEHFNNLLEFVGDNNQIHMSYVITNLLRDNKETCPTTKVTIPLKAHHLFRVYIEDRDYKTVVECYEEIKFHLTEGMYHGGSEGSGVEALVHNYYHSLPLEDKNKILEALLCGYTVEDTTGNTFVFEGINYSKEDN